MVVVVVVCVMLLKLNCQPGPQVGEDLEGGGLDSPHLLFLPMLMFSFQA